MPRFARSLLAAVLAVQASLGPAVLAPADAQTVVAAPGQTVTTGSTGQQILFRDKTSISAGPNSSVTVTRASYDPRNGSGNVVINVTKGAFRYITGDQAGTHTIKTPLSTVGVRGTVIEGYISDSGYEVFVLIEGAFGVTTGTQRRSIDVSKPGTFVAVSPSGSVSAPTPLTGTMRSGMLLSAPKLDLVIDSTANVTRNGHETVAPVSDPAQSLRGSFQPPTPPPPPPCVPTRRNPCP